MSTKIYDAFLWKSNPQELQIFLNDLREKYIDWSFSQLKKYNFFAEDGIDNCIKLWKYLGEQIQTGKRDPHNLEASVVVFFYENLIIIQFFGLDSIYKDDISLQRFLEEENKNLLQDFHYQNQTDPYYDDDDVLRTEEEYKLIEEEYENRNKVWKKIYDKRRYTPVDAGLVYDLSCQTTLFEIADKYFESLKTV